jgi:hypothetical protein
MRRILVDAAECRRAAGNCRYLRKGTGLCLMLALPQRQYLSWIHEADFLSGKFD